MPTQTTVDWPGGRVGATVSGEGDIGVLLAHGAGTSQDHPTMTALRDGLAAGGLSVMTFNYPYTERGSKSPDRQERLLECHLAAAEHLRSRVGKMFLAGRSMGGRMGTYLAAEGYPTAGLVLYAYPLHPVGKPERLRIDQFPRISVPMLFFQGTRDSLARTDLFERHIATLANADVEILEGAGHGPRGGGWTVESMTDRYVTGTLRWVERVSSGKSGGAGP
jgi:predicted alpha/beta-hydrolase family hydrolase